jgi:uncharacterized iron-regulated protein
MSKDTIMKITKEEKQSLKEVLVKHNIKEGIISQIFKKVLTKTLLGDKNFMSALIDADDSMDKLRKKLKAKEEQGFVVNDPFLRKWAGLDK